MPSNVAKMLDNIKSGIGKIVFDDGTGNLVLIDTPAKIREMEEVIQKSELPTVQRVLPTVTTNFVLQYAKVEDIEAQVKPLLTKDGGKEVGEIRTDKRTKTIIVTDLPAAMQKIADLVAIFDRAPKQVFIEAKIVEVKLTDEFRLGVKWDHVLEGLGPRFALQSASQFSPLAPMAAGGSLSYNTIAAGGDLNVVLNALATAGDTKVLSNPHIAALDGEEATIKVVTTQPYAETTYESGSTNVVGKSYKFVDVGVTLGVTPRINEMGFITMSIKPEVSSADTFYDSAGGQGVPVVKKQYAETSVSVKDGITIIIAGMITEQKEKTVAKVPFLGSIPVLGILFRSEEVKAQNTETVVLLTPRIVSGTKFFERSKDIKKPTKSEGGPEADAVALDKTP
jgi:general secretion pathway protein D